MTKCWNFFPPLFAYSSGCSWISWRKRFARSKRSTGEKADAVQRVSVAEHFEAFGEVLGAAWLVLYDVLCMRAGEGGAGNPQIFGRGLFRKSLNS